MDNKIWLAIYLQKKKKLNEKDKYHFWSFNKEIYSSLSFTEQTPQNLGFSHIWDSLNMEFKEDNHKKEVGVE